MKHIDGEPVGRLQIDMLKEIKEAHYRIDCLMSLNDKRDRFYRKCLRVSGWLIFALVVAFLLWTGGQ